MDSSGWLPGSSSWALHWSASRSGVGGGGQNFLKWKSGKYSPGCWSNIQAPPQVVPQCLCQSHSQARLSVPVWHCICFYTMLLRLQSLDNNHRQRDSLGKQRRTGASGAPRVWAEPLALGSVRLLGSTMAAAVCLVSDGLSRLLLWKRPKFPFPSYDSLIWSCFFPLCAIFCPESYFSFDFCIKGYRTHSSVRFLLVLQWRTIMAVWFPSWIVTCVLTNKMLQLKLCCLP